MTSHDLTLWEIRQDNPQWVFACILLRQVTTFVDFWIFVPVVVTIFLQK